MAPIVLFVYNRPLHTRRTLEALQANEGAKASELFVFADGPKEGANEECLQKIKETREVVLSDSWCAKVTLIESPVNKGLAKSIIEGVTEIVNQYGSVIVLEDDIVTGRYFLRYMNEALERYKETSEVFHITGWRDPVKGASSNGAFFYPKMDCWGWATWKDKWAYFKKDTVYYVKTFTKKMRWEFDGEGCDRGMWDQIEMNASGRINTWAIFWYASIFLKKGLCLSPTKSLVRNIGFDNTGVHCGTNKWQEITDSIDIKITEWPSEIKLNRKEFEYNKHFLRKKNDLTFIGYIKRFIYRLTKTVLCLILPKKVILYIKESRKKKLIQNKNVA